MCGSVHASVHRFRSGKEDPSLAQARRSFVEPQRNASGATFPGRDGEVRIHLPSHLGHHKHSLPDPRKHTLATARFPAPTPHYFTPGTPSPFFLSTPSITPSLLYLNTLTPFPLFTPPPCHPFLMLIQLFTPTL
ncbi:hypothetical protein E2C01_028889 [Portunus trituberculatus]|uniref:Uncharacterized protein n=1 Tax=Portunus trituberculatus TaxID=210409 RepID=A0A5B7EQG3_PORTR|nr:hypothetical protein [Portunus trituberculatus]